MAGASAAVLKHREGKVLVASPRPELRDRILRTLSNSNGHTAEAAGGAEALMKLASAVFRTLLLDPQLEDLDTEELVATIRTRFPHLEVVVLDHERNPEQADSELPEGALGVSSRSTAACYVSATSPIAAAAEAV
jgi:CheY-like chemotaxis protein